MTYLITLTTYGTHLPGDARGSFDHIRQGVRRFLPIEPRLEQWSRAQMTHPPFRLESEQSRCAVLKAMTEVCKILNGLRTRFTFESSTSTPWSMRTVSLQRFCINGRLTRRGP